MPITFDAKANAIGGPGASTVLNWAHTCSGIHRYLIVGTAWFIAAHDCTGVTYDGVAMTKVGTSLVHNTDDADSVMTFWYLRNPALGANTVVATWAADFPSKIGISASFNGCLDAAPRDTGEQYFASTNDLSVVIDSFGADMTVSFACFDATPDNWGVWTNSGTEIYQVVNDQGDDLYDLKAAMSYEPGVTQPHHYRTVAEEGAIQALSIQPLIVGRDRLVKYHTNTFDPRRRIIDSHGKDVPRELMKTGEYLRNEGPFLISAAKPASLTEEKSVGYIESLSVREGKGESIETVTETMMESLFRRLGGRAA